MARSPEYPDLPWRPPKSWRNANRRSVQLIVIHTTEGHEHATSAEDGAAYDARRTDGTSTHYFHDQNSTVQCVRTADIAHTAKEQGNLRGIHHELCGRAGQTPAQWADLASAGTLRQAARQCARDAKKWTIPIRLLTPAQVAAGAKGFCGHHDITRAFPRDRGDHTDPGRYFPWSDFLDMVQDERQDGVSQADVIAALASPEGQKLIGRGAWNHVEPDPITGKPTIRMGGTERWQDARRNEQTAKILAAITAGRVDAHQLAAPLAQALAPLLAGALPDAGDDAPAGPFTVDDLETALRRVLGSVDQAS